MANSHTSCLNLDALYTGEKYRSLTCIKFQLQNKNKKISTKHSYTATTVEEQSVTNREIADNVNQTAAGISEVNEKVSQGAEAMNNSSTQVSASAKELSWLSEQLKELVNRSKV